MRFNLSEWALRHRSLVVYAMLVLAIIPIVVFYLVCQKYIVSGVMAGAIKG